GETGWHSHPVSSFGLVLEGELEVQLKSGALKRLKAGEALAEVINTLHNGRNLSGSLVSGLRAGAVGQKLTVKERAGINIFVTNQLVRLRSIINPSHSDIHTISVTL
ncbi:MAG: cupin domain-containing protein, partial [Nitrosomonadales bacterium]|nr:cupin domain-containing protein [Nitrosomonadales bacterium]